MYAQPCVQHFDSLQPHWLNSTRFLYSWDFSDKNTGVGCHFLLQRIFLKYGSNPCLLYFLYQQADGNTELLGKSILLFMDHSPVVVKGLL